MTTPVVTVVEPTKAKAWAALAGSILAFALPLLLSVQNYLHDPWPAVIGAVLAVLTALGVRQTPNAPADTSIVPNDQILTLPPGTGYTPVPDLPYRAPNDPGDEYTNPYRR